MVRVVLSFKDGGLLVPPFILGHCLPRQTGKAGRGTMLMQAWHSPTVHLPYFAARWLTSFHPYRRLPA